MKVNEIEQLLVRYYDGETNEAEEKELKKFFAQEDIPAHLLAEKKLFAQLASQPEPETPEGLESKLSGLIDEWDTRERRTMKIKKRTRIIRLQWMGSIAASLLLLFSVGMYPVSYTHLNVHFHCFLHSRKHLAVHIVEKCHNPQKTYHHPRIDFLVFHLY